MQTRWSICRCAAILLTVALIGCVAPTDSALSRIPKTWDDAEISTLEIPLVEPSASPVHVPSDYYYEIPTRTIFKTYPVYHPDREPSGYIDYLREQEPEVAFDASTLRTEEDWIRAREVVFDRLDHGWPSGLNINRIGPVCQG